MSSRPKLWGTSWPGKRSTGSNARSRPGIRRSARCDPRWRAQADHDAAGWRVTDGGSGLSFSEKSRRDVTTTRCPPELLERGGFGAAALCTARNQASRSAWAPFARIPVPPHRGRRAVGRAVSRASRHWRRRGPVAADARLTAVGEREGVVPDHVQVLARRRPAPPSGSGNRPDPDGGVRWVRSAPTRYAARTGADGCHRAEHGGDGAR